MWEESSQALWENPTGDYCTLGTQLLNPTNSQHLKFLWVQRDFCVPFLAKNIWTLLQLWPALTHYKALILTLQRRSWKIHLCVSISYWLWHELCTHLISIYKSICIFTKNPVTGAGSIRPGAGTLCACQAWAAQTDPAQPSRAESAAPSDLPSVGNWAERAILSYPAPLGVNTGHKASSRPSGGILRQ